MNTINQQIQELQNMTATQLSVRYEDLFGEPPRVRNKAFLRRRVAWKIQELEFGGLSEPAKARLDDLIAQIDLPLGDPGHPRPRRAWTAFCSTLTACARPETAGPQSARHTTTALPASRLAKETTEGC